MNKLEKAKFLATISYRLCDKTNPFKGLDTVDKWVDHYMSFSDREVNDEYRSHGC